MLISGANGAVAKMFKLKYEHHFNIRFLTRNPKNNNEYKWDIASKSIDEKAFEGVSHIVHLAGANISGGRWTKTRKKELRDSRILGGQMIEEILKRRDVMLESYITASAVGYYGSITTEHIFVETDSHANDFVGTLCQDWENIADNIYYHGLAKRTCKLRFGVVLEATSGMLKRVTPIVKYGMGSALGTGKQYIPWIHIDDLTSLIYKSLTSTMNGAHNAVAPEYVTNLQLMKKIASTLNKPFFIPNVPSFLLKLIFGEMAKVVLHGSRVSSHKLEKEGFQFKYPTLDSALKDLLT